MKTLLGFKPDKVFVMDTFKIVSMNKRRRFVHNIEISKHFSNKNNIVRLLQKDQSSFTVNVITFLL